jgi:HAE1 family hydrophobic/amphiphilic exporter-1
MDDRYRRIVHLALAHRPTVVGVSIALVIAAAVLLPMVGFELVPQADEGEVRVDIELPVGTRIERTEAVVLRLEESIRQAVPEATMIITSAGSGGMGGFGGGGSHRGEFQVRLVGRDERERTNDQIAQALRRQLAGLPGVIIRARPSGGNFQMNRMLGGGDSRLALEIRGHDLDDSRRVAQEARSVMQNTPGVADVRIGREEGRPEISIRVDRPKAALFGLSVTNVAETIQTNVAGTQAAFYRERGNEYPIVVRLREEDRERIRDVEDVLLSTPGGQVVPAKNLMVVDRETGPVQIERKNQERIARVNAENEVTLSKAVGAIQERIGQIRVPPEFSIGFGSEVEEQDQAFRQLQVMLILAIILVYAVMASQYESLRDPFIIMFSVPVAAIGVVLSLLMTGTAFSLQAYIGVIMLAGIVVSNAILLVDYTNILRRRDHIPLREAVERAGRTRLRPILMTTLALVAGMLPLAVGTGPGAEERRAIAVVVIGGQSLSLLLTLIVTPVAFSMVEQLRARVRDRRLGAEALPTTT